MCCRRPAWSILAFAALGLLAWAALAPAKGRPARSPLSGGGETQAMSSDRFVGAGQIAVRGHEYDLAISTSVVAIRPADDGTLHVTTSHTLSFGPYTLVTSDKAVAEPTGVGMLYVLNSNMDVISGGEGRLTAHGFIDLAAGQTAFEFRGAVALEE